MKLSEGNDDGISVSKVELAGRPTSVLSTMKVMTEPDKTATGKCG
jgi:hypothetical protein